MGGAHERLDGLLWRRRTSLAGKRTPCPVKQRSWPSERQTSPLLPPKGRRSIPPLLVQTALSEGAAGGAAMPIMDPGSWASPCRLEQQARPTPLASRRGWALHRTETVAHFMHPLTARTAKVPARSLRARPQREFLKETRGTTQYARAPRKRSTNRTTLVGGSACRPSCASTLSADTGRRAHRCPHEADPSGRRFAAASRGGGEGHAPVGAVLAGVVKKARRSPPPSLGAKL